jgi:hypothetical protein
MLTYLPVALALLGTALMAVVIFAPVAAPATVTMSFAPPIPPVHDHQRPISWAPYGDHVTGAWDGGTRFDSFGEGAPTAVAAHDTAIVDDALALWPVRLDPRAAACDAAARIGLVEALASIERDWAREVLRGALGDEPDAAVRDAIERALREVRPSSDAVCRLGGYEDGLA